MSFTQGTAGPVARLPVPLRWLLLLAVSALIAGALEWIRLPAALLLGPLLAAVVVQLAGGTVRVHPPLMLAAQAVIGCLVARSITPSILVDFAESWPLFMGVVALSISVSIAIGWAISRMGLMPGSTAIWGMLPGGATAITLMAEAYGADVRLVAFMQYLRVVLVTSAASVVALLFGEGKGPIVADLLPPVDWPNFAATLAIALAGGWLGRLGRLPAGQLLGPLALGAVLSISGVVRIELPPLLLIASYALIGWNIGLRFTWDVLATAFRALPLCIAATLVLMAGCGVLAWLLVIAVHIDPLSAYLATSPGGVDAAAIISSGTDVDTPFIMALQVVRVILVVIIGPPIAKLASRTIDGRKNRQVD